ncbi:MAG: hypothetical protein J3Q66DRAFT_343403 [Benniella sp.]|nr:MAG: hypothetical protein J3Q66DRAFT_343403 [Benniella sp.]
MEPILIAVVILIGFIAAKVIIITCVLKCPKTNGDMEKTGVASLETVVVTDTVSEPMSYANPSPSPYHPIPSVPGSAATSADKGKRSSLLYLFRTRVEPNMTEFVPPSPEASKSRKKHSLFSKPLPVPPPTSPTDNNVSGTNDFQEIDLNQPPEHHHIERQALAR